MLKIKSLTHLAKRLHIDIETLRNTAEHIHDHCSLKQIKTKKGKVRPIVKASNILKKIQKQIYKILLCKVPIHPSAHGAVHGRSSKTNALKHCGQRYTYCLDLQSCFSNIHSSRVRRLFEEMLECSPDVSTLLTKFTTYNYQLAQGFSTSTAILNILCINMDCSIEKYISNIGLAYTRYVDDIT
ncbi:MAG: RNA-directed DNA polymerase [Desulfovibrio sp.]|nr:RNA-directed DNA polymerase [Desulfovibrio sp.]